MTTTASDDAGKTAVISVAVNKKGTKEEEKVQPEVLVSFVSISPASAVIKEDGTLTINISDGTVRSVIKVNYDSNGIKQDTQQLYFAGQNLSPAGIAVDNFGNLLLVNHGSTHTVIKYGKDGTKVLEFNTTGKNSSGPVGNMIDVAYDQNNGGMFYVLAQVSGSNVILRYDANGNFVRKFGSMQDSTSIAVGEDGTVYVADKGKKAIYQFAPGR